MSQSKSIIQQAIDTAHVLFKKQGVKCSERRILMAGAIVAVLERAHVESIINEKKMEEINNCAIDLIRQDEELFNKKSVCVRNLDRSKSRKIINEN